jgi:hypothetical protein
LHRENLCAASQVKHLYLLDSYIDMARRENPLAIYMAARSMLEFNAFLHEVSVRLREASSLATENWLDGGRQFFGIIVRARFATSRSDYKALLQKEGLPEDLQKPFRVGKCIKELATEADYREVGSRYEFLCDFVHHNLASGTAANAGSTVADAAFSSGGGMIFLPSPGTVTQYEYPVPKKAKVAIESTAAGFLQDGQGCVRWINEMPGSPYSQEAIQTFTGTELGFTTFTPQAPARGTKLHVSRNDRCPCGSGRKYKKCCLH